MTKGVIPKRVQTDRCHRCGGLMVEEKVFEIGSFDWRCVSCGERVNAVILVHRLKDLQRIDTDKLLASKGKARLN